METTRGDEGRRRLLRGVAVGVIAAPFVGLLRMRRAAAEQPRLDPASPQARAMKYVQDAGEAKEERAYREGAQCANCVQWTGADKEWGGCLVFPGKLVYRKGWCMVWAKKA